MDIRIERDSIIKFEGITDEFGIMSSNVVFWKLFIDSEYVASSFDTDPQEEFSRIIEIYKLKDKECLTVNGVIENTKHKKD